MFRQIPVLPVVVPLTAVVLAALLWRLRRRGRVTAPRAAVAVALSVYAAGIVANTVFPIFLDKPASRSRWTAYVVLVPFQHYEVADAVVNVLVFVPIGVLVALVLVRPSWWRVPTMAAAASLAIEVTQYVTAHLLGGGHIADMSDFLSNVAGGALGYGLLHLATAVPVLARVADRFRWHPTDAPQRS